MNTRKSLFMILTFICSGLILGGLIMTLRVDAALVSQDDVSFADQREAVNASVVWLIRTHQNPDGGYGVDFNTGLPASNVGATVDAIIAISSGGFNPAAPFPNKDMTPIAYLAARPDDMLAFAATSGGAAGKIVLALTSANQNARDFAGQDWVAVVSDYYDASTGQYAATAFNQALAILALSAVDAPVPADALKWLIDQQAVDGSWNDGFGTNQNADTTALAIMALLATGGQPDDQAPAEATIFLANAQTPTGGWEYGPGFGENANSTALVVQALSALGEDFYSTAGDWDKDGVTPLLALLAWQNSNGAFQTDFGQGRFDDFFSTVQAIPAATGKAYPLPSRYEAARAAVVCLATLQDVDTGGWEQFAGFGINAGGTARAVEAIGAFGDDPQDAKWTPGDVNAVAALENQTPSYFEDGRGGRVGTVMQGVIMAGEPYNVDNFAGLDLPLTVSGYLSPTGEYASTAFGPNAHAEAMLGLLRSDNSVDPLSVDVLMNLQTDGDWGSPDATGIALNVLGRLGASIPGAVDNLASTQSSDGGWGFGGSSSPSSTSEIVQGLAQNNQNPFAPQWSQIVNGMLSNPADAILAQQGDNGCWPNLFGPGDDPFSTTDAIVMLSQDVEWYLYEMALPVVIRP